MESLGKIFGSNRRVKIMRLFLSHGESVFDVDDIISRSRIKKSDLRKELTLLTKIGFIKKKSFFKNILKKTRKKNAAPEYKKTRKNGWILDTRHPLIKPLSNLLLDFELINEKEMTHRIKKTGSIKLLVLSGMFVGSLDRKIDILVVGNKIKRDMLYREMAIIESEIGCEITYSFFDIDEFNYRMSMYDKLIRDVLEQNHIKLINTLVE